MARLRPRERLVRRRFQTSCIQKLQAPEQQTLVEQLRAEFLAGPVKDFVSSGSTSWDSARRRLADHVRDDDPRRLLQWREIRSTMFVSDADYVAAELSALKDHDAWQQLWRPVLTEDPSGCPTPSRLYPDTSDNLIHHTYHVLAAEGHLGSIRGFDEIVEFGGGYGGFARLLRRLGVTNHYHIHDLPEFTALQRYYLASVAAYRREPAIAQNFTWGSSMTDLPHGAASRLFVGLWSLSEMPVDDREPWCDVIAECDGVLVAFQSEFEGVDNREWFDALRRRIGLNWKCWEIPHLPGHFYLVGRREDSKQLST